MKIICDGCGAKYSIADEKVAGKVFKIRCKKCSDVILVRGDQMAAAEEQEEEATRVFDYGGEAVWHVVVDGDQQGPFVPSQLGEMLTAGSIDWEAYVWREGFDGWLAARDVPELVSAITDQPQAPAAAAAAAAAAPAAAQPAGDMGADPFAGQQAPAAASEPLFGDSGGGFGAQAGRANLAHSDANADLFAQGGGASPFDSAADDVVASPSPRLSEDQAMTGQRNENSVLFSLSNLQALATGSSGGGGAAAPAAAAAAKDGYAAGEGSGLIDIRALASAKSSSGGGSDNVDDLLSLGSPSPLGSALGAPILAPVQEERTSKAPWLAVAAIGGVVVLGLGVAIVFLLLREQPQPLVAGNPAGGAVAPAVTPVAAAPGAPTPGTPPPAAPTTPAAANPGSTPGPTADDRPRQEAATPRRNSRTRRNTMSSAMASPTPRMSAPPPRMSSRMRVSGSIDDLLNDAIGMTGMRSTRMATTMSSSANLPATPPRDAVARALRSVQGRVSSCGRGQHGVATTQVTVSGSSGRVSRARVSGQFAGTPVASCVERAVRGARFPRFSRSSFSVTFPYRL